MLVTPPEWVQATITRFFFDLAKLTMLLIGGGLLIGGPDRMTGPAYASLVVWGGGPDTAFLTWGGSLFLLFLASLIRHLAVRRWSYTLGAAWLWVWWAAVVWTTAVSVLSPPPPGTPLPGFTGVAVFFILAVMFTGLAAVMWLDRDNQELS